MRHHLLSLPSGYIQSVLPAEKELSGVKSLTLDLSQKVQVTGEIHWTDIPSIAAGCQGLTMQMWLQEGQLWVMQMS